MYTYTLYNYNSIMSFSEHLLSIDHMPGIVLGTLKI
jgi:hypothetical protein